METLEARVNEVARIAVRLEQHTACPAQLLIAQWAIDSKWGEKAPRPWKQYQNDRDLLALVAAVAPVYATDSGSAHLAAVIAGQTNVNQAITQAVRGGSPSASAF